MDAMSARRASPSAGVASSTTSAFSSRRRLHLLEQMNEIGGGKKWNDDIDDRHEGEQRRRQAGKENPRRVLLAQCLRLRRLHMAHRRQLEIFAAEQIGVAGKHGDRTDAEEEARQQQDV